MYMNMNWNKFETFFSSVCQKNTSAFRHLIKHIFYTDTNHVLEGDESIVN